MRLGADASVAIITELSDKRRCMRWHNWRLQYDVCHRRRQAAVGATVCSECSAADKHANWCATWVKCCWLWEIYVRIADSCQKWAARRDSGKQPVSAVCICSSSSICKHYNDPTTSGPDGIISAGVANFCSSARRNGTRAWHTEQLLRCPMPFYLAQAPAPVLVVGCAVPLKPSACINWNSNLRTKSQNVSGR